MQRMTMLLATTLLTTGCGTQQDAAARIEAARTEPAAAVLAATPLATPAATPAAAPAIACRIPPGAGPDR